MNLKRIVFSVLSIVCMAQAMQAIPAYPYPRKVKQADGSYITVLMRGDEHGHFTMTADGYPVTFNEKSRNYEYASLSQSGAVTSSGIVAADAGKRSARALAFLKSQHGDEIKKVVWDARNHRIAAQQNTAVRRAKGGPMKLRINDFPTLGDQHSLVILVQFSDLKFTTVGDDPKTFYTNMLNQEGFTYSNGANGSARDFYIASSSGRFTPTFDVAGPVTVSKTQNYYGANYGGGDQYDRVAEMIVEACEKLDPVIDFSKYDTNNDGYVDNIYIFYAGYGEADSGKGNTIWPHAYKLDEELKDEHKKSLKLDGKIINSYSCSNEIIASSYPPAPTGIGTFVHEFGHVLGLGDHYSTAYNGSFTPGIWDTMDMGSYSNNMNTPPLFSAFERGELGWLDYTELSASTDTLIKLPELGASNFAYRISVDGTNGREFYVLENRQQKGWDTYLPGHGMLMWHIDIDTTAWNYNVINNTPTHQHVDIVEADGRRTDNSRSGDAFPGTANVRHWDMMSWAGDTLMSIGYIDENNELITMLLKGAKIDIKKPELKTFDVADSTFSISWEAVERATDYRLNVSEVAADGTKTPVKAFTNEIYDEPSTIEISDLKPQTTYEVSLAAGIGTVFADATSIYVTTTAIPFRKLVAPLPQATGVGATSFTAEWQPVDGADSYAVTLYRHDLSTDTIMRGFDFANKNELPAGWQYQGSFLRTTGAFGKSAPSLRFSSATGGYVTATYAGSKLASLDFWGKRGTGADSKVYVETCTDSRWTAIDSLDLGSMDTKGQSYHYTFSPADSVRVRMTPGNGVFYIDDMYAGCLDQTGTPVEGFDNINTGDKLEYTFTGLDPEGSYGVRVVALQGEIQSLASPELTVDLKSVNGISHAVTPSTDGPVVVYDLTGRRIASPADAPKGVYIIRQGSTTKKVFKR